MSTLTPSPPSDSEDHREAEAVEALIEEARQRARRRRRGYAASALVVAAAGLIGFALFSDGGGTRAVDRADSARGEVGAGSQVIDGRLQPAPGLEGGRVTAFAVDPRHPNTLFAATLEAGIFKSADGARTWRPLDLAPGVSRVDALAVAPGNPETVYAGTGSGVFRTTDGGRSWQATSSDLLGRETAERRAHRFVEGYVYTLLVDQRDADIVYAGTWEKGVFKTEDGGRSWRRIGPSAVAVSTLALDPRDPATVYAGTERGVHKSTDGGATWRPIGLRGRDVTALAVDPEHPDTVFSGTLRKGVFKTTDGGANWRSAGLEDMAISGLMLDVSATGIAYAWDDGVFKTENGGRSWRSLDAGASASALAINPREPATIYVGARGDSGEEGVSKSLDGGNTWRPMNAGLTAARVSALALDPDGQGTAYAAVDGRGVFKRVDGRWRAASAGLTTERVHTLAVDPQNPSTVYAGTDGPVLKSTDGGAHWDIPSPLYEATGVSALAVHPRDSATIYAITTNESAPYHWKPGRVRSHVFKSPDGAGSWPTGVVAHAVDIPAASSAVAEEAVRNPALAIDPLDPDVLYAGGLGVVKSVDGGVTWQSAGLRRSPVFGLAIDPEEAGVVYAATETGLFKSRDAGASWEPTRGGLDGVRVEAVAIDPERHLTVYAGTDRGVYWSADGGSRWRRFAQLPLRPFDALAVHRAAGVLYAGSYGGGVYELELAR